MAFQTLDGNEAVASVAYRLSETIAIYPITPASVMGEHADDWAALGKPNLWGQVPGVVEMQSEAGAAGAMHGALQAGSLVTTFTASQGLLLMLPNLFKIAGELSPFCMHVAARSVATHALSIFCDHSDVMSARGTGFALLASGSVQEAQDLAAIGHAVTLESRIPVMHFFDGFRTSHEIDKIVALSDEDLQALVSHDGVEAHRDRRMTPDRPVIRGTSQNPDAFFQSREATNPFYQAFPERLEAVLARFGDITGRRYQLFDYVGHPEAERVVILMGSGAECAHETVEWLVEQGQKVGVLKVRLFRPFASDRFLQALPDTVKHLAVLDRTKEPGAQGEPLLLEVSGALMEAYSRGDRQVLPRVIGGRYGLSSREFTPAMVCAVFDQLNEPSPKTRFTVGVRDDVTHLSLDVDSELDIESPKTRRALFFGLGADGTVSSNKSSIKILGEGTDLFAQGHFVYDSKKSGATTVSHLRFGPLPIRSSYQIRQAQFVAVHAPQFLERFDVLEHAASGATVLLNVPWPPDQVWDRLSVEAQRILVERKAHLFVIDAAEVAEKAGLERRINTVMQVCFFALDDILPRDEAIAHIKESIRQTWGRRGPEVVRRNVEAVDSALANLHEVTVPGEVTATRSRPPRVPEDAPDFVQKVTRLLMDGQGEKLPVSAFPPDGTWPTGTSQYEKRSIALEIPIWESDLCVQCNFCAMICPHTAITSKVFEPEAGKGAPDTFEAVPETHTRELEGLDYRIQVAPEDCTGCGLCVEVCPAKDRSQPKRKAINMRPLEEHREAEAENLAFLRSLPDVPRDRIPRDFKSLPLLIPLFEYSGACAGCGETPYIRLLTQLLGDRLLIANATGCSSIYGGNLPTTPYTVNADGRGPTWNNSLFEDAAELGLGMRMGLNKLVGRARQLLEDMKDKLPPELFLDLTSPCATLDETAMMARRQAVERLRDWLSDQHGPEARELASLADELCPKSVWVIGGDGWAYDIGYGGLDHALASGQNIKLLVLDTEVYSNTGGQQSKATPMGAIAKFAAAGKETRKKDLGLLAMSYGHVYVAQIAIQSHSNQTTKALQEAENFDGPALIIAHSPCIAHGYDLVHSPTQQKRAVDSWAWPIYRFDPRRILQGLPPLQLDSVRQKVPMKTYMQEEARFRMLELRDPQRYEQLASAASDAATEQRELYMQLAGIHFEPHEPAADPARGADHHD
ncbi:pyruvate:ferredoxin (flavodoxin) oxidoreductase [Marinobacter panjinensis]|uniref:Pyruvate-flavodoxin oxidoreductase n=1 Tax=Marinobacter panjinensis TaxID=2576384 RepID=A0A4U6R4J3_9GAMM|nr:pyruvate:ferredoxin (flavodoxin) oxidoreductase [Marinobacter panjinensis]MCR8914558.1 pyruvate:ferredoxin (flavodoxin) oxidoreductase [Marinobacter panjinensis]TKV68620.1 pyruvate:ferredoxin (flavodoxin) oxidoreductase [Marinobacter panjinensis]